MHKGYNIVWSIVGERMTNLLIDCQSSPITGLLGEHDAHGPVDNIASSRAEKGRIQSSERSSLGESEVKFLVTMSKVLLYVFYQSVSFDLLVCIVLH